MILGTRARPRHERMKRTTSMSEISYDDISILNNTQPSDQFQNPFAAEQQHTVDIDRKTLLGMVSPRLLLNRRNSADFAAKSSNNSTFLRTCSLCRRRLTSGRDIFMYKGDTAYCSLECRQQQMAQDEWKEKCEKGSSSSSSSSSSSTNKEPLSSNKGETVAVL